MFSFHNSIFAHAMVMQENVLFLKKYPRKSLGTKAQNTSNLLSNQGSQKKNNQNYT